VVVANCAVGIHTLREILHRKKDNMSCVGTRGALEARAVVYMSVDHNVSRASRLHMRTVLALSNQRRRTASSAQRDLTLTRAFLERFSLRRPQELLYLWAKRSGHFDFTCASLAEPTKYTVLGDTWFISDFLSRDVCIPANLPLRPTYCRHAGP